MAARPCAAYSGFTTAPRCVAWMEAGRTLTLKWRSTMTWETPAAIDLRFGFEITMYIANR